MNNKKPILAVILVSFLMGSVSVAIAFDKNTLVWKKCVRCHASVNGSVERIEEMRTTPEEWTVIIDRMRRLHGMRMKNGEMAALLKELCASQILTPEEEAQVSYINLFNNPQVIESPRDAEEEQIFTTCVRCHSAAKIFSRRMTQSAWEKQRDFHLYVDPAIMFQLREMHWRSEADKALKSLARKLPYQQAWSAGQARLEGSWLLLGVEPGKGNYRGKATIKPMADDEYTLQGSLRFTDGTVETFSGEATLFGGYALRTRTSHNGSDTMGAFSYRDGVISGEHHHQAPDFRSSTSTWYPVKSESQVLRVMPAYLLTGEETRVLIEGIGLPEVSVEDIELSTADVHVLHANRISPESVELVLAYQGTGHTEATLSLAGMEATGEALKLQLAPRIDYLKISPDTGRARVNGGANYPAEGVQFQALAYSQGADTSAPQDDRLLGPVAADFSLTEEETRPNDDDLAFMGAIDHDGTYLPNGDYGPIPTREYGGEGTGLVRVIAEYERGEILYTATGRLVVTVPDYIQRLR